MSAGVLLALVAGFAGALAAGLMMSLMSREAEGWLIRLPHLLLRLARRRLPEELRDDLYDEWAAELLFAVRDAGERPLSRLALGTRFAIGLWRTAPQVAREFGGARSASVVEATGDAWLDNLLWLQARRREWLAAAAEFQMRHYAWCNDPKVYFTESNDLDAEGQWLGRKIENLEDQMTEAYDMSPWGTLRGGLLFDDDTDGLRVREFIDIFVDAPRRTYATFGGSYG